MFLGGSRYCNCIGREGCCNIFGKEVGDVMLFGLRWEV